MEIYFWAAKMHFFWSKLDIPVSCCFFFLLTVGAGSKPTYKEKIRVPPPPRC